MYVSDNIKTIDMKTESRFGVLLQQYFVNVLENVPSTQY